MRHKSLHNNFDKNSKDYRYKWNVISVDEFMNQTNIRNIFRRIYKNVLSKYYVRKFQ